MKFDFRFLELSRKNYNIPLLAFILTMMNQVTIYQKKFTFVGEPVSSKIQNMRMNMATACHSQQIISTRNTYAWKNNQ